MHYPITIYIMFLLEDNRPLKLPLDCEVVEKHKLVVLGPNFRGGEWILQIFYMHLQITLPNVPCFRRVRFSGLGGYSWRKR